jgi:hypothetical protein
MNTAVELLEEISKENFANPMNSQWCRSLEYYGDESEQIAAARS